MDKLSYALGMAIGHQLKDLCLEHLEVADFAAAVSDVLAGKQPQLGDQEAQQIVQQGLAECERRQQEAREKAGAVCRQEGEAFLTANGKKEGVMTLPSGLQYEVINEGTGRKPKATDQVKCHYEGTLIDGTVFDSSYRRNQPATFPLNGVIKGWTEGLQLMSEGAKYRFYIPYQLAYGAAGAGASIPPYAALIFDVELIEVI